MQQHLGDDGVSASGPFSLLLSGLFELAGEAVEGLGHADEFELHTQQLLKVAIRERGRLSSKCVLHHLQSQACGTYIARERQTAPQTHENQSLDYLLLLNRPSGLWVPKLEEHLQLRLSRKFIRQLLMS